MGSRAAVHYCAALPVNRAHIEPAVAAGQYASTEHIVSNFETKAGTSVVVQKFAPLSQRVIRANF